MWKCPRCGEGVEDDFDVCWSCGSNREGQENPDFVPEREGILSEAAYESAQAARRDDDFVTVAIFARAPEAHMARSRLEAEGIHGYVMDELSTTTLGFPTLDGVPLQVAPKDLERARAILADVHHNPDEEDEAEEEEE
jgi:hypothetical protein